MKFYTLVENEKKDYRFIQSNWSETFRLYTTHFTDSKKSLIKILRNNICSLTGQIGYDYLGNDKHDDHYYYNFNKSLLSKNPHSPFKKLFEDYVEVVDIEYESLKEYIEDRKFPSWVRNRTIDFRQFRHFQNSKNPDAIKYIESYPVLDLTTNIGGMKRAYEKVKKMSSGELVLNLQSDNYILKMLTKYYLDQLKRGNNAQ